jgi:ankyrin repeat protein
MRALALLLLLSLYQSPASAPDQPASRKKLSESKVPFTPDSFIRSVMAGDKEKAEWFLKSGMSPDTVYQGNVHQVGSKMISSGDSALIIALILSHADIVSLLLSHGADVNTPSRFPASPLMLAAGDLVITLLDRGADINWRGYSGFTALQDAAQKGDLEKVGLLLEQGADINAKNERGWTALQIAAIKGRREVFALLRTHGADIRNLSERAIRMAMTEPDPSDEILNLIRRLRRTISDDANRGPSAEDQQQVPARLLEIASRSAESRQKVIDRMMDVVEDLEAKHEWPIATAWMKAVDVLGDLKATEALYVLIDNLDHTGQNGIIMSIHIKPVSKALRTIGEPAVLGLIEALAHPIRDIRTEAAWVLYTIDKGRALEAIEAARRKEEDEEVRKSFEIVPDKINKGY